GHRQGPRLSFGLFRDARRAGLDRPVRLAPAARTRPVANGAAALAIRPERGWAQDLAMGPRQRLAAIADRLSRRRTVCRHRLPAFHLHAGRPAVRVVELRAANREGAAKGALQARARREGASRRRLTGRRTPEWTPRRRSASSRCSVSPGV